MQRRIVAAVSGVVLLAVILGLVFLDGLISADPPQTVALRDVQFREPPPPPPPPQTRPAEAEDPRPQLSQARMELPLELTTMDLDLKVPAGKLSSSGSGWGEGLGVDLGTVNLEDLDGIPMVISAPIIDDFPQELLDKGVKGFNVVLHISIDEQGRPELLEVLASGYPPYNPNLRSFVSAVRFTPPTVLGVPVRTEYAWPLLIQLP